MESLYCAHMRILVTGGAGFIGSHFVELLEKVSQPQISEIIIIDSLTYAGNLGNLDDVDSSSYELIKESICNEEVVSKLVGRVDTVVNFAAESHVDNSITNPSEFIETNIVGTQVLLNEVKKNPSVKFIQISTDEVYGSIASGSWKEDQTLAPNSPYSASKASADLLALAYRRTYDLDVIVTRASNNYGTRQYPEKLIPKFVKNLVNGIKVPIYGDGLNVRDWLHVNDHCRGIIAAMTKGKSGEIYNLGGGNEISNLDVTKQILDLLGINEDKIDYVEDRAGHDYRYSVDAQKAQSQLDWVPQEDFNQKFADVILWYAKKYKA